MRSSGGSSAVTPRGLLRFGNWMGQLCVDVSYCGAKFGKDQEGLSPYVQIWACKAVVLNFIALSVCVTHLSSILLGKADGECSYAI